MFAEYYCYMSLSEHLPVAEITDETTVPLPEIDKVQAASKIVYIVKGFDPENYAMLTEL
jgi:mRNA degradation ribonuclease J1/J2